MQPCLANASFSRLDEIAAEANSNNSWESTALRVLHQGPVRPGGVPLSQTQRAPASVQAVYALKVCLQVHRRHGV